MSNLINFNFNNNQVQVITLEGEPWFVASEVCYVLETDVNDAMKRLEDDEKLSTDSIRINGLEQIKSKWLVSESGLYSLVLSSRKPRQKPLSAG